jgi:hypothetical protein
MRRFILPCTLSALALGSLRADVLISEFLADNQTGIEDENGDSGDWIELLNTGSSSVNLGGWWLTDNNLDKKQWTFPAVSIPANGTLLVWASGKNRVNPAAPLHTNFSLSRTGGFLGLYYPHPSTGAPVRSDTLGASYPAQAPDVSYGVTYAQSSDTLVGSGQNGRYRVLANDTTGQANYSGSNYAAGDVGTGLAAGWNVSPGFNDAAWTVAAAGIGFDTGTDGVSLLPWINGNCASAMKGFNPSILFRRVFPVANPAAYSTYKLRMKYEDGFVAWLNGTEIGRSNAPASLAHNSTAASNLNEAIVNSWTEFTIPSSLVLAGNNVLAVQGLNITVNSSDFLLLPEIVATALGTVSSEVYFNPPTPGAANSAGSAGPVAYDATPADPLVPRPLGNGSSPPMKVTVRVIRTKNNVSAVRAFHRTMWNAESTAITLNDTGTGADTTAADGIYSANLPTTAPAAGQMFRWRFEVQDTAGNITKLPAYATPADSPQYFGTVAADASTATSQLPLLEWFVEGSPANGPTAAAFRGSCYYLGRFYDNTGHEIHGQTTSGFAKKSYDFDSNTDHRFVWKEGERPVKDLNLLTNYADKTKSRNTLSHEVGKLAGTPYHFAFPVRVHLNGGFHGVMDLVEDGDDRLLERNGLDGDGAFYKIYSENLTPGAEKKTRQSENNDDLAAMAAAMDPALPLATRRAYAYDNINLPATVNYLVVRQFNSDRDHGHKNFYLYRDTNRTREWRPIIWDVDLSQGHNWNGDNGTGGYFNDTLTYQNPLNAHNLNDRFYNIILESPEMRDMWVRRMRTLMDQYLQPPGTVNGFLETRMRAIAATIDPDPAASSWTDGDLDTVKWGINSGFIQNRPREEVERLVTGYFGPRRSFLFNNGVGRPILYSPGNLAGTQIPNSGQTHLPGMVTIDSVDFLPASGNQDHEYILLKNTTATTVDLSGWTLDGAIDHVFEGGTVILPGNGSAAVEYKGLLHVAKDAFAFRSRTSGPTGGQMRLVQGNYQGQLSARGETLNLRDPAGQLIATFSYPGAPSALQQFLRISEIQYHPAPPSAAEDLARPGVTEDEFEYLELVNTGSSPLQLAGSAFTQGITFTFPTRSLAAGERIVLAKNPAAFALRHPSTTSPVLGPYDGVLANTGESLELTDPVGEVILDFEYKDGWYPATDGSGRALVLRDPATPHHEFGDPVRWAISAGSSGSPGSPDTAFAQAYYGWDNFHFTSVERDDPLISGPAADPDGDGRPNADEYALGTDPRTADAPVLAFTWSMDGSVRRPALRFRRPAGALDVTYELLAGGNLASWPVVATTAAASSTLPGDVEEVVFRDSADDSAPKRFLKLRYVPSP